MFGPTDDAIASIRAVLAKHPGVTSAVVFGSRALGRAHDWSDIDISLSGTLNALEVERIAVKSPALRAHLGRAGQEIYRREAPLSPNFSPAPPKAN